MADDSDLIALTIDVVSAYVGYNNMRPDDVPALIASTHGAIKQLDAEAASAVTEPPAGEIHVPAVTARKSLASPDFIVSMIDGKPYKTLKRHLAGHGLTPTQYRERYKLKSDYPMVAQSYSETRKALAHKIGLGRKSGTARPPASEKVKRAPRATKVANDAQTPVTETSGA